MTRVDGGDEPTTGGGITDVVIPEDVTITAYGQFIADDAITDVVITDMVIHR